MNNKKSANAYLGDAEVILEECRFSFERMHWHRVVRKCQEASELAVKGSGIWVRSTQRPIFWESF